jgi:hypothetical protein
MSWKNLTVCMLAFCVAILMGGCATSGSSGGDSGASAMGSAREVSTGYQPIQSDLIYSVNYDQAGQVLTVVLYEDGVYDYSGVPEPVYRGLLDADDKDAYYEKSIQKKFAGKKFEMK